MARRRILYVFPDRSSEMLRRYEEGEFWVDYRAAADRVGLDFGVAAPDHIAIGHDGVAYWRDEPLSPDRDIIVYGVRTGPTHKVDLWTGVSLVISLRELGFHLPIPLDAATLLNDKFATVAAFADSPVPPIPTARITADRDVHRFDTARVVPDDWFPVFVKPTSWSGGQGCVPCADRSTLDSLLGLASGSATGVVIQPQLPEVVSDIRVVAVDSQIVAILDRRPRKGSHVANVTRGGSFSVRETIDPRVHDLVKLATERLDLSYLCIDLLETATGELWLSELEADGAVSRLLCPEDLLYHVIGTRFSAYERQLDAKAAR
ncbi:ATP-grasp domain-containing protein [Actinokineospora sp. HUAS TT18]|uniref:ATP-grasp domain-containing protein n=1 Tax=Actinokineospora sp. HUAS TT18 TaxID=3447451 RepID=UPI003F51E781